MQAVIYGGTHERFLTNIPSMAGGPEEKSWTQTDIQQTANKI
jgi:hypothetical protein